MKFDLKKALTYYFREKNYKKKILIAYAINLLSFLYIPGFFFTGYRIGIIRQISKQEDEVLPDWKNWGSLFLDGLKVYLLTFIFAISTFLIFIVNIIPIGLIFLLSLLSLVAVLSFLFKRIELVLLMFFIYMAVFIWFSLTSFNLYIMFIIVLMISIPTFEMIVAKSQNFSEIFNFQNYIFIIKNYLISILKLLIFILPLIIIIIAMAFIGIEAKGRFGITSYFLIYLINNFFNLIFSLFLTHLEGQILQTSDSSVYIKSKS